MIKGGGKKAAVVIAIIVVTSVVTAPVTAAPSVNQDSIESATEENTDLIGQTLVNFNSLLNSANDSSKNETSTRSSNESEKARPKKTATPSNGDGFSIQCISLEPGDGCDADDDGIQNGEDPCPRDPENDCEEATDTPNDTPTDSPDNPNDISIEGVSGPDGSTTDDRSTLETTLSSTEGVESVKFVIQKEVENSGETIQDTKAEANPSSTSVQTSIKNDVFGTGTSSITVEYRVVVKFDTGSDTNTIKSDWNSYTYTDSGEDVLYVPVTFKGGPNSEPDIQSTLTDRANKTRSYYQDQSNGEVDITSEWLVNSSQQPYFTLPGSRDSYRKDGDYDREKIICDGISTVYWTDTKPRSYDNVFFIPAEQNGDFIRGIAWQSKPFECSAGPIGHGPNYVVVSTNKAYGEWAHELGHALFNWGDYYGGDAPGGQINQFGIMGQYGTSTHAPTVSSYHRLDQGWADEVTIETVSDDKPRSSENLDWLANGGDVAKYNPDAGWSSGNGVYEYVLIGARNTYINPVPLYDQQADYTGGNRAGRGVNIYLVSNPILGRAKIDRVTNPQIQVPNRANRTVTLRTRGAAQDEIVKDPDLGYNISVESVSGSPEVTVQKSSPENLSGVNIYTKFPCQKRDTTDPWECETRKNIGTPLNEPGSAVTARFEGSNGSLGQYPNGTTVNSIEGATHLNAGSIQKLYVPSDSDTEFNVTTSTITENTSIQVATQMVTRDADGDRIASDLRVRNLSENDSFDPELARLNTSRHRWHAGSLRTQETNSTTVQVENNGIRELENVTVQTDTDWARVNQTSVGTIESASTAPVEITMEIPGGTPVGNYTFNVTVTGDGTAGSQTKRIPVTVHVLPTARWETSLNDTNRTIATENTTTTRFTVRNKASSNVPIKNVETVIDGNISSLDVTLPRVIEELTPGESAEVLVTVRVPDKGIAEGNYAGDISVQPLRNYTSHFTYPIPVSSEYDVVTPASESATLTVDVHGPSTNASATFHPKEQPPQRMGTTTRRLTVDAVKTPHDVPAEKILIQTSVPDGWNYQDGNGSQWKANSDDQKQKGKKKNRAKNGERDVGNEQSSSMNTKVWIVEEGPTDTPAGHAGKRTKLGPDDYTIKHQNGSIAIVVEDITRTQFEQYMTSDHRLEAEIKLTKDKSADSYDYATDVGVVTYSPIDVFATQSRQPTINVVQPGSEDSNSKMVKISRRTARGNSS